MECCIAILCRQMDGGGRHAASAVACAAPRRRWACMFVPDVISRFIVPEFVMSRRRQTFLPEMCPWIPEAGASEWGLRLFEEEAYKPCAVRSQRKRLHTPHWPSTLLSIRLYRSAARSKCVHVPPAAVDNTSASQYVRCGLSRSGHSGCLRPAILQWRYLSRGRLHVRCRPAAAHQSVLRLRSSAHATPESDTFFFSFSAQIVPKVCEAHSPQCG